MANIFVLPLDIVVWYSCGASLIIVFVVVLFQLLHPLVRQQISPYDFGSFLWGVACQQGTHLEFPTLSARIIAFCTFLMFEAIFTSYSANIVALLQSPNEAIKDIYDLAESPLVLSIQDAPYNRLLYLNTNVSLVKSVYERKVEPQGTAGWICDPFEGIERIRTELLAFHVDNKAAYKAISQTYSEIEKCSLSEMHFLHLPLTTIPVEKNSPLRELFSQR